MEVVMFAGAMLLTLFLVLLLAVQQPLCRFRLLLTPTSRVPSFSSSYFPFYTRSELLVRSGLSQVRESACLEQNHR